MRVKVYRRFEVFFALHLFVLVPVPVVPWLALNPTTKQEGQEPNNRNRNKNEFAR